MNLWEYRDALKAVQAARERLLELKSERITQSLSGMPAARSREGDRLASQAERIDEARCRLDAAKVEMYAAYARVAAAIAPVQGRAHEILNLRYITGLSMGQIARALHLPRSTVYRLHDRAVRSIH